MKRSYIKYTLLAYSLSICINSCKKQDNYLDIKRLNSDVVPSTLADYQAILDNDETMNQNYPTAGLASSDNFYITDAAYPSLEGQLEVSLYTWAADIWMGPTCPEWNYVYQRIEYANIVLDGIQKIAVNSSNQSAYNNLKGSALFYRAIDLYNAASMFCKPYTAATAKTDLGVPIRLTSDVNPKTIRSTVQETYDQIIKDLKAALPLLPQVPLFKNRPSSVAANALLSKVYLSMEDYADAGVFAGNTLNEKSSLMDYNDPNLVNPSSVFPFPANPSDNPEIIFYATGISYASIRPRSSRARVDSTLYKMYDANDMRTTAFFRLNGGRPQFKGTYDQFTFSNFAGIATDEVYLISAECYARQGNLSQSLQSLNALLSKRYVTGTFTPISVSTADSALKVILVERRKELLFTAGIRWEDLRRLNKDPRFAITLTRVAGGQTYTLAPNDKRYVFPIGNDEIQLTGIEQNPR